MKVVTHRLEIPSALRVVLLIAGLMIIVAGLRAAASWLVPLALALFVAVISLPVLSWFRARGIPGALAVLLVLLVDSLVLIVLGMIVVQSAGEVRDALPAYILRFEDLQAAILARLHGWGVEVDTIAYDELFQSERIIGVSTALLRGLTDAVSAFVLVLLFLIFLLIEAARFPAKLRAAMGDPSFDLKHYGRILQEVQSYLALKTAISLITGVLVGTGAAILGVDFALLWGFIAFLLNFVPSIGSIIAAIPAVLVALLQLGPGTAIALAVIFLAVNVLLGNIVEPALLGRRLGLSTLFIIVSLVFWGWVWGPVGMLLALPLTLSAKIALERSDELRWLAILMGPAPPISTEEMTAPPAAGVMELPELDDDGDERRDRRPGPPRHSAA
jgi:AI-2 transport protein TqsA